MATRKHFLAFVLNLSGTFAIVISNAALCGCSAIGFGLGGLIDGPDKEDVPVGTAMDLNPGDHIRVSLAHSSVVEGVFKASVALDSTTYASRQARFLDSVGGDVPKPGDTLFLHMKGARVQFPYLFRGYGSGCLKLLLSDKSIITTVGFTDVDGLEDRGGKMLDLGMLEGMADASRPPGTVFLAIQTTRGISRVPLDDIERIEKVHSHSARWIGLGIGMAIDVASVVVFITAWKEAVK